MERQRLDKWLWHARVVKARTSAAALVEAGHVRINGVREKSPGHAVKAGDVLTIGLDNSVRMLKVAGFSRAAGRCRGGARALRGFAERARNNYLHQGCGGATPENAPVEAAASLAAAQFLRYANPGKLIRFGALG